MSTSNRVSLDTDTILLRRIFAFQGSGNVPVPENGVLTTASNGIATFTNPFITLSNLDPSFTKYLPSTLSTISSQLAQAAEVSQAEFQDLSSNVKKISSSLADLSSHYYPFAATTNTRLNALEVSGSYVTKGDLSSAIAGVNQNISTLSTQVYTDISALSTGIRSYILTNPTGALLSTTFKTYSTAIGQDISTLSTTINNYSTYTVGLSNYTSSRISVLSGTIVELSTFIVNSTSAFQGISTFSAQVYSTINSLSSTTNNNLWSTTTGIYTHPTLSNDGYITGSFAVKRNTVAAAGTAFTVNTGNDFVVLDSTGQGRVGIQTTAPTSALDVSGIIKTPALTVRNTTATASVPAVQITTNGISAQLRSGLSDLSGYLTAASKLDITAAAGTNPAVTFDLSAKSTTVYTLFEAASTSRFYFDTLFARTPAITPTLRVDPSAQQVLIGRSTATQGSNYSLEISGVAFIPRIEINHAGGDANVFITSNDGTNNIHGSLVWGNANVDATSRRFSFRAGATRDIMVLDDTGSVGINQYPSQTHAVDVSGRIRTNAAYYHTTNRVSIRTNTDTGLYADTSNNPGYVTLGSYDWSGSTYKPTLMESPLGILSNIAIGRKDVTSYSLDVSGTSHFGGAVTFDSSFNINSNLTVSGNSYFNPYVGIGTQPSAGANLRVGGSGIISIGGIITSNSLNVQTNTYLGGVGTATVPLEVAGNALVRGQIITSNVTQNIFASADSSDSIYFDAKRRRIYGISGTGFGSLALQVAQDGSVGGYLGVGNANPAYILDVCGLSQISKGLIINNPTGNNAVNPALIQTSIQPFEIRGATMPLTNDAGILQLTGGGGTNVSTQSYIKLIGYNDDSNYNRSIRIGTSGTERIKIDSTGNVIINRVDSTNTSRLVLGPSPGNNNYDYCSIIESQDLSATDARSVLKFYTHSTSTNFGMPDERMRIDQIGRVGISTTDPQTTLNVVGTVRFDYLGQQNAFYSPTTNNTLFIDPHNDVSHVYIGAGNTVTGRKNLCLQFDSTGNSTGYVGINTNTPTVSLDVSGTVLATQIQMKKRTGPNTGEVKLYYSGTNNERGNIAMNGRIRMYAENIALPAGSGEPGTNLINNIANIAAENTFFNNGNNVGINTSSPQSTLDVSGTLRLGSGSQSECAISFRDSTGNYDIDTGFYSLSQGRIGIAGNGQLIGELNSNGRLAIGKIVDATDALDISGTGLIRNSLTVYNYIEVGSSSKGTTQSSTNTIFFAGTAGDYDATKKHTAIAERIYSSSEDSELLLFKGNDANSDRIRLLGNGIRLQSSTNNLYYSKTSGKIIDNSDIEYSNDASFNTGIDIASNGNVGIRTVAPTSSYHVEVSGNVNFKGIMYNNDQSGGLIPRGAIIMWSGSTGSVPNGWVLCDGSNGTPNLRDRFIVGAGSAYGVNSTGGSATTTLTVPNLPAHTHDFSDGYYIESTGTGTPISPGGSINVGSSLTGSALTDTDNQFLYYRNTTTASTGSATSFSILPPYYALAFIMKT
jgi:hypothetical protein